MTSFVEACHVDFKKYIFRSNGSVISLGRNYKNKKLKGGKAGDYNMINLYRNDGTRVGMTVHKIIMEVFKGVRPDGYVIDHVNDNKKDNRLCNLRYVSPSYNSRKPRKSLGSKNKSGIRGVFFYQNRWYAAIYYNQKLVYRESFDKKADAIKARFEAEKIYWPKEEVCSQLSLV